MEKEILWATKWAKTGWFTYSSTAHVRYGTRSGTVTIRLDILSYHLIRWIHGPQQPSEMLIRAVNQRLRAV